MVVIRLLLLVPVKYSDLENLWKFQLPSEPLQERRASAGDYCRRKRSGGTKNGCRGENGRNQGLKIAKEISSPMILVHFISFSNWNYTLEKFWPIWIWYLYYDDDGDFVVYTESEIIYFVWLTLLYIFSSPL